MKKLLMKWFPKYFNVCQHTFLNFEDLEASGNALELVVVDDESNNTFDKLGISDERGEFIMKEVKKAMIDVDCRVSVIQSLSSNIKHINEFYIAVLIMEREIYKNSGGGLGGFLKAIIEKGPSPEEGE